MNSVKIMFSALLLSMSLGAFAQDEDELTDAVAEEESSEVFVPSTPSEKKIFQRVQLGFAGTVAKYTNNNPNRKPDIPAKENYFLKGISLGWVGDIILSKKMPLYLEAGAIFTWQTGSASRGPEGTLYPTVESSLKTYKTTIQAFTITIPINVTYQFRNCMGVDGLTLAPFAGPYLRFNLVAKRKQTTTTTIYNGLDAAGNYQVKDVEVKVENKSLREDNLNGRNGWMEGRSHKGKLVVPGIQLGVNAFYKRYSFGLAYMYDLIPFAKHNSPDEITYKAKDAGGRDNIAGTGCDMKINTRHNFALTVGYTF